MLDRLDASARQVLLQATEHAKRLGHDGTGSEHLLLALLDDDRSRAVAVLEVLGLTRQEVRDAVRTALPRGRTPAPPRVPFTSHARVSLENAMREAVASGSAHIGEEHLLSGLLRAGDRGAGALLRRLGVDRARAQALVAALPDDSGSPLTAWQRLRSFRRRHATP